MPSEHATSRRAPRWSIPNEHGFWAMLAASVLSSVFRADAQGTSLVAAAVAVVITVSLAGAVHRRFRSSTRAQLVGSSALALVGASIELVSALPLATVVAGAVARAAIFLSCAGLVRAAFARSGRAGRARGKQLDVAAVTLALVAGGGLAWAGHSPEAVACLAAGVASIPIALAAATTKALKPLGLALAAITLATAVVISL